MNYFALLQKNNILYFKFQVTRSIWSLLGKQEDQCPQPCHKMMVQVFLSLDDGGSSSFCFCHKMTLLVIWQRDGCVSIFIFVLFFCQKIMEKDYL